MNCRFCSNNNLLTKNESFARKNDFYPRNENILKFSMPLLILFFVLHYYFHFIKIHARETDLRKIALRMISQPSPQIECPHTLPLKKLIKCRSIQLGKTQSTISCFFPIYMVKKKEMKRDKKIFNVSSFDDVKKIVKVA